MYNEPSYQLHEFKYNRNSTPMTMNELHLHEHYEIYYLLSGQRKYYVGSRIFTVNEGEVVLIPPNILHKTAEISQKHERVYIMFIPSFLGLHFPDDIKNLFSHGHLTMPYELRSEFENLLAVTETEYFRHDKYSSSLLKGLLMQLLVFLLRNCKIPQKQEQTTVSQIIEKSADYINQNYSQNISLDSISKSMLLSASYFSKCFKAHTGLGFHKYLEYVRIMNAEKLLTNTNDPITEVASKCGFDDSNYFAAVFKRHKGITPLKYRQPLKTPCKTRQNMLN